LLPIFNQFHRHTQHARKTRWLIPSCWRAFFTSPGKYVRGSGMSIVRLIKGATFSPFSAAMISSNAAMSFRPAALVFVFRCLTARETVREGGLIFTGKLLSLLCNPSLPTISIRGGEVWFSFLAKIPRHA
jgi:hypothetical protein